MSLARRLTVSLLLLLVPAVSSASEAPSYRSARLLGMGGSNPALPHGADALWQNPAALGLRPRGVDVELLNPIAAVSEDARRVSRHYDDPEALMLAAARSKGPMAASAGLFPNVLGRGFGVGVVVGGTPEAFAHDLTGNDPRVDVAGRAEGGLIGGGGWAFAGGRLAVGGSVKALKRIRYADSFDEERLNSGDGQAIVAGDAVQEGFVGSVDVGAIATLPTTLRPTLGVTVTDAVATGLPDPYPAVEGAAHYDTSTLRPGLHVGAGVAPRVGPVDLTATVGYDASGLVGDWDRVSAGVEATAFDIVSVRGGMAHQQPTAGIGVDLKYVALDAATYAEPSQTDARVTDRHYVLQLTAGF